MHGNLFCVDNALKDGLNSYSACWQSTFSFSVQCGPDVSIALSS